MADTFPKIANVGLSGVIVSFSDTMGEAANWAAIAFRVAVEAAAWKDVTETSSTLVSCFVAVDLTTTEFEDIRARLITLLGTRDWLAAAPPPGRKLWTLPMCFGTERAPQLGEAAKAAGVTEAEAKAALAAARTRVITIGYAPGQPYLGLLDPMWNLPRQAELTPSVPAGALVIAIRQFVIFTATMPTGWRHIGQTAFRTFDPDRAQPVVLSPGDEIKFSPLTDTELAELEQGDSLGGATWQPI